MSKAAPTEGVSATGVKWKASSRPAGQGADWENARSFFQERTTDEWLVRMTTETDVQNKILGDIYREVKALEERESGNPRIGRRPKFINGTMDEIHDMITPRFAMGAFADSVQPLILECGGVRAFARKAKMNHTALLRMIAGEMVLDIWRLEAMAKAGGVHPAYFKEWREAHILTSIAQMLEGQPNVSIKLSRALAKIQQNGR